MKTLAQQSFAWWKPEKRAGRVCRHCGGEVQSRHGIPSCNACRDGRKRVTTKKYNARNGPRKMTDGDKDRLKGTRKDRVAASPLAKYRREQLAVQGGMCGLCGCASPGSKGWMVDHCHRTDARGSPQCDPVSYRGVLCAICNVSVVGAAEASEFHRMNMKHADAYLKRWESVIAERISMRAA